MLQGTQDLQDELTFKPAGIIGVYPLQNPGGKDRLVGESFMGFASTFESLGFAQVSHRSGMGNIYRLYLPADEKN